MHFADYIIHFNRYCCFLKSADFNFFKDSTQKKAIISDYQFRLGRKSCFWASIICFSIKANKILRKVKSEVVWPHVNTKQYSLIIKDIIDNVGAHF